MNQYELFPFLTKLEENWKDVLEELDSLLYTEAEASVSLFEAWHEKDIYEGDWDVYGLYQFGRRIPINCDRCPKTTALVESIPGMVTAGFSALAPGTHIKPHVGYTNEVLRCHLGLVVPKPLPSYDRRSTGPLVSDTCGLGWVNSSTTGNQGRLLCSMTRSPTRHTTTVTGLDLSC